MISEIGLHLVLKSKTKEPSSAYFLSKKASIETGLFNADLEKITEKLCNEYF